MPHFATYAADLCQLTLPACGPGPKLLNSPMEGKCLVSFREASGKLPGTFRELTYITYRQMWLRLLDIGKVQTTLTCVSYSTLIALSHFLTLPVSPPVSILEPFR